MSTPLVPGLRAGGRGWRSRAPRVPTGVLVLLSLDYLTSLFYYIPKSALAAVIIMAVAPLFDTRVFGTLWRVKSTCALACLTHTRPGFFPHGLCRPRRSGWSWAGWSWAGFVLGRGPAAGRGSGRPSAPQATRSPRPAP